VIASDWGSFTEIVTPDVGARFRTPLQGAKAFEKVQKAVKNKVTAMETPSAQPQAIPAH